MAELSHVGMTQCFFCQEAKDVLLDTRLRNTLPRQAIYDMEPCSKCKEHMQTGIILISVRDGEDDKIEEQRAAFERQKTDWLSGQYRSSRERREVEEAPFIPNPYRSGGWWVLREEAIRRIIKPPEMAERICRCRWAFIPDAACKLIGLEIPQAEPA